MTMLSGHGKEAFTFRLVSVMINALLPTSLLWMRGKNVRRKLRKTTNQKKTQDAVFEKLIHSMFFFHFSVSTTQVCASRMPEGGQQRWSFLYTQQSEHYLWLDRPQLPCARGRLLGAMIACNACHLFVTNLLLRHISS